MEDKIVEEDIEMIDIMTTIEAKTGQEKGYLQEIIIITEIEVQITADPGQAPGANTNRDRIRCYNCREYDHFARDCPNSREEGELEKAATDAGLWKLKNKPKDKMPP